MVRVAAIAGVVLALVVGSVTAADKAEKAVKAQMVKGTIKTVDAAKNLLIVKQKLKTESVDRELSITEKTEFVIKTGKDEQAATGQDGLRLLEGKEGSSVQVKCDKDVNVLKVTVTVKK